MADMVGCAAPATCAISAVIARGYGLATNDYAFFARRLAARRLARPSMKVFISWAGDTSKGIALALRELLPTMLQGLKPFVSTHDIDSGSRWSVEIASQLEATNYGLLCLTPSALASSWLMFEAGALTKLRDGKACGLLHGVALADLTTGPLSQFQHKQLLKDPFLQLLQDLNQQMAAPLEATTVNRMHEKFWPDLEAAIAKIPPENAALAQPKRKTEDVLEDLVLITRSLDNRVTTLSTSVAIASGRRTPILSHDEALRLRRIDELVELSEEEREVLQRALNCTAPETAHLALKADPHILAALAGKGLVTQHNDVYSVRTWVEPLARMVWDARARWPGSPGGA